MTDPGQPLRLSHTDSSPTSAGNSIDSSVETVLTSLRETQPSPNLTQRLLETIASHEAATAANPSLYPLRRLSAVRDPRPAGIATFPPVLRVAGWLSLAAALVLSLSLAFLHRHHPAATANTIATADPTVAQPAITPSTPSVASTSRSNTPGDSCCQSTRSEEPPQIAPDREAKRRVPLQAAALHPSHLASFPAPPLPLTSQEKLLLRVAQAQNPQQSPILNPALRASIAARDDESFQIFFAQATTIKPYQPSN